MGKELPNPRLAFWIPYWWNSRVGVAGFPRRW